MICYLCKGVDFLLKDLCKLFFDIIHTVVLMHYIPFIVRVKAQQFLYDLIH